MNDRAYYNFVIVHQTSPATAKRANAAYLIGAFQIIILGRTAEEAWRPFIYQPNFIDFRDAIMGPCSYRCTILHCLKGLEKAIQLGWFNYRRFDCRNYEYYERVENGDFNWIIPGKLLAFSSPSGEGRDRNGWKEYTPEDYVPLFRDMNVTAVVRLNQPTYEAERFSRYGIRHYDMYFLDGSVPNDDIIQHFLKVTEREPGAIAVHCKAGLGRTGTLIGCYAIKHFEFPAAEFIGWCRLARPGSVLGPQQQFLIDIESKLRGWGSNFRRASPDYSTVHHLNMSPIDHHKALHGDTGQAHRLLSAKKSNQNSPVTPIKDNGLRSGYSSPYESQFISRSNSSMRSGSRGLSMERVKVRRELTPVVMSDRGVWNVSYRR